MVQIKKNSKLGNKGPKRGTPKRGSAPSEKSTKTVNSGGRPKRLNSDNTTIFVDDGIDVENRVIHLFTEITQESTSKVIRGIHLMLVKNQELPIDIYINTEGGCAYSSFGLHDFIKSLKVHVRAHVMGQTMSGGTIILMAADERIMYKNSVLMIHSVATTGVSGKVFAEIEDEFEECKKIYKQMCEIYAARSNISYSEWNRKMKYKNIHIRADEALEAGLIDKIVE